ncbi:hypothetical protein [Acetivibrio straminisolvens]|uniref:Alginate lyase n=1 Tax=Acetivibrio straminisolvens JCM 21531 TaxID=1294263 RepID=W4V853_9FIRM|nr:hypothetical protein [Acetivibrio straminisolvens]GAE88909.1 hypothetical protein JCM21531_2393 [Acetivibrio straminisolvens JCM 21531]
MLNHFNPNNCQAFCGNLNRQMTPNQPSPGNVPVSPSITALPPLPTGYPTGPMYTQMPSPASMTTPQVPTPPTMEPEPETIQNINYTQGYLKRHIGARVKVEFLIGTNMLLDREGTLVDVGTSYIIIREVDTDDLLLADLYSIKFVRFYY